jgi:chromosomal replication initiation ATPase DnaA
MADRGLDQRFTFENFIVGTANRLAAAAARRVADAPGKSYNPLFLYAASGLGKTHLLHAIGNYARRVHPGLHILCDTLERALHELPASANRLAMVQVLLLDDVQYLGGDRRAQETLLPWWDELWSRGAQIVLAADRPPSEFDRLDHRLLSRFSAGLVADMAPPDHEMRTMLVRRRVEELGATLDPSVTEAIARIAFANVRELQGGLNRVLAAQELDARPVQADDVEALLGVSSARGDSEEFDAFLTEVAGAVEEIATRSTPEQRLVDAILRYEGEGIRTYRLEVALRHPPAEPEVVELVEKFAADVERLNAISHDIRALDPDAPELARADLLRNPDRLLEAETLVAQVHERLRPLPEPPAGPDLDALGVAVDSPALSELRKVARRPGARSVPLYVRGDRGSGKTALLEALARQVRQDMAMLPIALVSAPALAAEIATALRGRHADAWRARYRRARMLIVDDFDRLEASSPVREELFRLFDGVRRAGGQVVFAGVHSPAAVDGVRDRLGQFAAESDVVEIVGARADPEEDVPPVPVPGQELRDTFFLDPEKTLARWPFVEDWLVMEVE